MSSPPPAFAARSDCSSPPPHLPLPSPVPIPQPPRSVKKHHLEMRTGRYEILISHPRKDCSHEFVKWLWIHGHEHEPLFGLRVGVNHDHTCEDRLFITREPAPSSPDTTWTALVQHNARIDVSIRRKDANQPEHAEPDLDEGRLMWHRKLKVHRDVAHEIWLSWKQGGEDNEQRYRYTYDEKWKPYHAGRAYGDGSTKKSSDGE